MFRRLLTTLTAYALLSSSAAFACRRNMPIAERIAKSDAGTVVLAHVEQADYIAELQNDYHPWEGFVVVKHILKGRTDTKIFPIGRSGSSAACDDGIPAPKPGDAWVLYLKNDEQVANYGYELAYPLDVARDADPDLNKLLTSSDAK